MLFRPTFVGATITALSFLLAGHPVALTAKSGPAVSASQRGAASLIGYAAPGGESYFALSLSAANFSAARLQNAGPHAAHDHVLLVDTSASQAGAHRKQSLAVLDGFLSGLNNADRVQLIAIDVAVDRLTCGFCSPRSDEFQAALRKLRQRVPLGCTSLLPGLEAACRLLTGDRSRSLVYIGDGMSAGSLINASALRKVIERLREQHIPVSSFAIGPRTDLQLLAILAQHTGGVLMIDALTDDARHPAQEVGTMLASAADAPVLYPSRIRLQPEVDALLPSTIPPVRPDRQTVLLGRGPLPPALSVTVDGTLGGQTETVQWIAKRTPAQAGNTFLAGLWADAERDQGLNVPLPGDNLLNLARETYEDQVQRMVTAGKQAVRVRNGKRAEQIAWEIRQADPANVEARAILNAARKLDDDDTTDVAGTSQQSDPLAREREARRVRAELLKREVTATVAAAERIAASDPDASIGELKRALNTLIASTDIDADIREQLRSRLKSVIDRVSSRRDVVEMQRIQGAERKAQVESQRRLTDQIVQRDEKLQQLMDRVRSLLVEGYLGNENAFEEAEAVARAAWELAPYSGATVAAIFDTEAAGQLDKAQRLRYQRNDKLLETLYQVELAHVPFPDEPPLLYPPAEVWKALTERRKKWAAVDLVRYNAVEERIRKSLDAPTEVQFIETPLKDALLFIKEQHGINLWLNEAKISDEGVATDTPITLQLSGVTLRSVLKLMLEPLQLTYLIDDEVMKITTVVDAGEKLSTRVYPVASLVIPIRNPRAAGLGQGLGGVGGIGGAGGTMGGGQFGVGGGGRQGNGFGGGGGLGMFSLADGEPQSAGRDPAACKAVAASSQKE